MKSLFFKCHGRTKKQAPVENQWRDPRACFHAISNVTAGTILSRSSQNSTQVYSMMLTSRNILLELQILSLFLAVQYFLVLAMLAQCLEKIWLFNKSSMGYYLPPCHEKFHLPFPHMPVLKGTGYFSPGPLSSN